MLTTYTFEVVKAYRSVEIECSVCGEWRKRSLKAFQTLSPYNKNADGSVKTRADIYRKLPTELDKMERALRHKGITCKPCAETEAILAAE